MRTNNKDSRSQMRRPKRHHRVPQRPSPQRRFIRGQKKQRRKPHKRDILLVHDDNRQRIRESVVHRSEIGFFTEFGSKKVRRRLRRREIARHPSSSADGVNVSRLLCYALFVRQLWR